MLAGTRNSALIGALGALLLGIAVSRPVAMAKACVARTAHREQIKSAARDGTETADSSPAKSAPRVVVVADDDWDRAGRSQTSFARGLDMGPFLPAGVQAARPAGPAWALVLAPITTDKTTYARLGGWPHAPPAGTS
jgi:hypothetical protein